MAGITYSLLDFVTGKRIIDLPIRKGASWSAQLGRPDSLSCSVNMRQALAAGLDLRSASEPNKTVMIARTDEDVIIAWGLIGDDGREWDEDGKVVDFTAAGIEDTWLGRNPIGPASALISALTVNDAEGFKVPNPALNTTFSGMSHGTIGKRLVAQLLTWPGAPTVFDLPPDEVGTRTETYSFASLKSVGSALSDLTEQEDGPDFAFRAVRDGTGIGLRYQMIHGSEAQPRIGSHLGVWPISGPRTPITNLKVKDSVAAGAFAGWMTGGKQSGNIIMSRVWSLDRIADGYPPLSIVDTSRSDVSVQTTLDSYNRANTKEAAAPIRDISFSVRSDVSPYLGSYRPGDTVDLDVPTDHLWLPPGQTIRVRIMSMSGDEKGKTVKIGCVIVNA